MGGGGDGGVVYRYVSAIVMFCLRELTENSDDHLQTNEEPVEAAMASRGASEGALLTVVRWGWWFAIAIWSANARATPRDAQDMSELTKLVREWSARCEDLNVSYFFGMGGEGRVGAYALTVGGFRVFRGKL